MNETSQLPSNQSSRLIKFVAGCLLLAGAWFLMEYLVDHKKVEATTGIAGFCIFICSAYMVALFALFKPYKK